MSEELKKSLSQVQWLKVMVGNFSFLIRFYTAETRSLLL